MKKGGKIVAIVLAIITAAAAAGVGVFSAASSKVDSVDRQERDEYDYRGNDSKNDSEEPVKPAPSDYDDVDYYGCPNSKRVKKLNLKKKAKV